MATLGQRLRKLRRDREWTQKDVERMTGIHQGTLTNLERNKVPNPTTNTLGKLAALYGVTVDYLLRGASGTDSTLTGTNEPPIDLFRAAHFSDQLITDLTESWARQPASFRSEITAQAERLKQAHEEEEKGLRAKLDKLSTIL